MTMETGQQAPETNNAPPPDPDAAKYDELRKELGLGAPETDEPAAEPAETDEPAIEPVADPARAKPEHVPYAEHENVQKALRAAREAQRAADDRLAGIMELVKQSRDQRQPEPKREEPAKIPDVQEDPIGHFTARAERAEAMLQQALQGSQQTAQQLQATTEQQQLLALVQQSEAAILDEKNPSAKPDYWDACAHLETQRIRELERMYPEDSPFALQYARSQGFASPRDLKLATLNNDRRMVAIQALQMGVSPAELYYNLALDRGYQAKAPKPNGKDVSLAEKARQQLEGTKKGLKAATSLSGDTGGRKGANDMSLTDLAALFIEDPEAADKVWDQMAKAGKLG